MGGIKMHQKVSLGNIKAFDLHIYVKMVLKRIFRK
jgi:hypothetical protein